MTDKIIEEKPQKKVQSEMLTIAELANATGNVRTPQRKSLERHERPEIYSIMHSAASSLHGWAYHMSATGEQMRLTKSDYDAALAAAAKPGKSGRYEPHGPAVSPQLAKLRGNR